MKKHATWWTELPYRWGVQWVPVPGKSTYQLITVPLSPPARRTY